MNILVFNTLPEDVFQTFYPEKTREKLERLGTVTYWNYEGGDIDWKKRLENQDVMITNWGVPKLEEDFCREAGHLKLIAHTGGSVGDLPCGFLGENGIRLLSGNRFFAESVAQATICYMLMGQRRLFPVLKGTEQTGWFRAVRTDGLRGKTVGLMGFGMIAKNVARMLQVFGCRVQVYSSHSISPEEQWQYHISVCSLEELFATSDIVSLHSGLTEKTYHMVDGVLLSSMRDDGLLVNTARGALIDEAALERELSGGRLRAVLDVFEVEPLPMDSGLRKRDNVVIVPHMGGPTTDVRGLILEGLIDDISRYFRGEEPLENEISAEYARNMTSHTFVAEKGRH